MRATIDGSATASESWGTVTVTGRCCGAGSCRNYAPDLLVELDPDGCQELAPDGHEPGAFTGVRRQPRSAAEYQQARTAAAACGFGAIKLGKPAQKLPSELRGSPWKHFPRELEPGVWMLGQPSTRNYGATAFFLEREGGGVLVDLPKPSKSLFAWLREHGGVSRIFLTHADHAQHHAEFVAAFPGAKRMLGRRDVNKYAHAYADATTEVELLLDSDGGPLDFDGHPLPVERMSETELVLLPQPGHTPGGFCLLYRGRYLFTGDHLAYSHRLGHPVGARLQCWQDWEVLTSSVDQLAHWAHAGHLRFAWLLPGHGEEARLCEEPDADAVAAQLDAGVAWMREQPPGRVSLLRWVPFVLARTAPESFVGRVVNAFGEPAWVLPKAVRRYLTTSTALAPR
ncbi:MAG: MBL fold metallo-hydrolase [Deltaproteobacteria bacterium]|nr:MAG: MBL fold metallo-hydrolase [Deltaproteobacteria bacterium]